MNLGFSMVVAGRPTRFMWNHGTGRSMSEIRIDVWGSILPSVPCLLVVPLPLPGAILCPETSIKRHLPLFSWDLSTTPRPVHLITYPDCVCSGGNKVWGLSPRSARCHCHCWMWDFFEWEKERSGDVGCRRGFEGGMG